MMDVDERVEAQRATLARAKAERKNAAARAKYRARVTESGEPEPVAATTWWARQVPVWEQAYRVKVALDAAVAAIAGAVAATAAAAAAPLASRIACNGASSAAAAPLAPRTSVSGAAVAPRRHCAPVTCAPTCVVDAADDDTIALIMSQSREVLARLAACCRRLHTLATMHPVLWKLGTLYRHQSAWRRRQQAASVWRLAHPSPPYHAERASIVKQFLRRKGGEGEREKNEKKKRRKEKEGKYRERKKKKRRRKEEEKKRGRRGRETREEEKKKRRNHSIARCFFLSYF